MNTELVFTPVTETAQEIFVRTQLTDIIERLDRIENTVSITYKALDMAFTRFEAMTKSPLLGSLFSSMTKKKDG